MLQTHTKNHRKLPNSSRDIQFSEIQPFLAKRGLNMDHFLYPGGGVHTMAIFIIFIPKNKPNEIFPEKMTCFKPLYL